MTDKVYVVVTRKWAPNASNEPNSCSVDSEAFTEQGKARNKATHDIEAVLGYRPPLSWFLDEDENQFVEFSNIEGRTNNGEPCKQTVRWEIHALSVQPLTKWHA